MNLKIPLIKPVFNEEMLQAAVTSLKTERFLKGESVKKFEDAFANYIGTKYALAVNSGTTALFLSLISLDIKPGDYVITTPASFIATANSVIYTGAKPIFVDIRLDTYTIDPNEVEQVLKTHKNKRKIKVILPVHLYGYPAEMDEINELAEKYNLNVLEDACQAHGAVYKGKKVGSLGDIAGFSFYPSKNLTVCGDGGMVTTNNQKIAETIEALRDVGRSRNTPYLHEYIGYTARMNTVNAAIGSVQLKYLDEWNKKRRKIAKEYNKKLDGIGDLILPPKENSKIKPVYHLYVVRTKYRDQLKAYLKNKGVECGIHYPIPIHLQPPYKQMGFREGMYPNTEKWAQEVLSLPMHPELTREEIEYIISCIEDFFRKEVKM